MIRTGTIIALCGTLLIALPYESSAIAGFIVIGLGCAPVYPCIIHSTPSNFGAENSQELSAYRWQAPMLVQHLYRLYSELCELHKYKAYAVVYDNLFLLLFIMHSKTQRLCRNKTEVTDSIIVSVTSVILYKGCLFPFRQVLPIVTAILS